MSAALIERLCDCCGTSERTLAGVLGQLCDCPHGGSLRCLDCARCAVHCACENGMRVSALWREEIPLRKNTRISHEDALW